jgi:hypothetical protein
LVWLSTIMTPGIITLGIQIGLSVVAYISVYYALSPPRAKQYIATALEALR